MNNKGCIATVWIVSASLCFLMTTTGIVKTAKNGVLQENGKKIWQKVLNKGPKQGDTNYITGNVQPAKNFTHR